MIDLLTRLDAAYKSTLDLGDLWNLCEESSQRIRDLVQQCEKLRAERNGVRVQVEQPLLLRIRELESINADLYEALKELTAWARDIAGDCECAIQRRQECEMIERMDAALAKARGES